jgi:hypothetical protein
MLQYSNSAGGGDQMGHTSALSQRPDAEFACRIGARGRSCLLARAGARTCMKTDRALASYTYTRDNGTGNFTDDASAVALCNHLQTCVLVAKESASKVDTNDAVEVFRSGLQREKLVQCGPVRW